MWCSITSLKTDGKLCYDKIYSPWYESWRCLVLTCHIHLNRQLEQFWWLSIANTYDFDTISDHESVTVVTLSPLDIFKTFRFIYLEQIMSTYHDRQWHILLYFSENNCMKGDWCNDGIHNVIIQCWQTKLKIDCKRYIDWCHSDLKGLHFSTIH